MISEVSCDTEDWSNDAENYYYFFLMKLWYLQYYLILLLQIYSKY